MPCHCAGEPLGRNSSEGPTQAGGTSTSAFKPSLIWVSPKGAHVSKTTLLIFLTYSPLTGKSCSYITHALNSPKTKAFAIKRNLLSSSLLFCCINLSLGMVGSGVGEGSVGIQERTNISKVSSFTSFPPSLGI